MLVRRLRPTITLGLALALAASTAAPSFAKTKRHTQSQEALSSQAQESAPGAGTAQGPLVSQPGQQGQCWIPSDDDRAYGYYGACNSPKARQMK